jgi:nucleoside-diphosphate-sugar epimerase
VIGIVSELAKPGEVLKLPSQRGDVRHTAADTSVAREAFGYQPVVSLRDGLARMVEAAPARVVQGV